VRKGKKEIKEGRQRSEGKGDRGRRKRGHGKDMKGRRVKEERKTIGLIW
jgi:hypothetical protein